LSNEDGERPIQGIGNKGMDIAKMFARRMVKDVAKKLIKKLVKLLTKILMKLILKALIWLLALFGIEAIIILVCVIFFAGAAIFIGKSFGWISDGSVDKNALLQRYENASASTSVTTQYRAPTWLLQDLDNIRILKENRDPKNIDPEGTVKNLSAEEHTVSNNVSVTTWTVDSKGVESSRSSTTSSINLTSDVLTWNRKFTYKYTLFTDDDTIYSVTTQGNGHSDATVTHLTSAWIKQKEDVQPIPGGSITKYSYQAINTVDKPVTTSNNIGTLNGSAASTTSSTSTHKQTSHWEITEIDENPDYQKFESTLISFNFSRSDFNFLQDAIKQDDPNLLTIETYTTDNLAPSTDDPFMGGGNDIANGNTPISDSPNIPSSSDWAFPTNKAAVVTSGFGYRYDPVYLVNRLHKGIDLARSDNSATYINYAVADGEVVAAGDVGDGYGNKVVIDHGGGIKTLYGHMKSGTLQVKIGDHVSKGKALGVMGMSGAATGVHLHFEVRINDTPVNPVGYLRR
jgi:murein DD-endopeptidase MepM/ murein hydrolase activator NlpD